MRIVSGKKIILEIPVKFINHPDSPGLKRGGVLNIVRRKVELKCPAENIPDEIVVDLVGTDIGTSIKISSVKFLKMLFQQLQIVISLLQLLHLQQLLKNQKNLQRRLQLRERKEKRLQKELKQLPKRETELKKMIKVKKVLIKNLKIKKLLKKNLLKKNN